MIEPRNLTSTRSSRLKNMKLLHLVYEGGANKSIDYDSRTAFKELSENDGLNVVNTYPYYDDWLKPNKAENVRNKILGLVDKHKPDIIFWQHVLHFPVDDAFFRKIKQVHPGTSLIYHEGDPFGFTKKKVTKPMACILRNSDFVFWVGLGTQRELAIKHGARNIYFAPHCFDTKRFWDNWNPTLSRKFDVTMIASSGKGRLPFNYVPGGRNRKKCIELLTSTFGDRFSLYGHGWKKSKVYRGPMEFSKQHEAIRQSWISANWDHFEEINFYASNRLPISLAAGVPHITTYHRGFEYLFNTVKGGLYFAHSPSEVVDIACYLLSKSNEYLIEEGLKAKEYAYENLRSAVIFKNILVKVQEVESQY